jgi:AbrB family looped-hinge helix DNA binding protein
MKRKGQITIPQELRVEFDLDEGAIMDIDKENNKIVITPLPPLEAGEPVGEEEFKKIIAELDERRRNWR